MQEYTINVGQVEQLQMIKDTDTLDQMFTRAKSTVVQGGSVILLRQNPDGSSYKFDELTNADDLEKYKETVYRFL